MQDFIKFIREQGVVGFAIGFVLGGAVSKLVTALVQDLINPIVSAILGSAQDLANAAISIGPVQILWGHFLSALVDFVIIAFVVYFVFKKLGVDKLDKKKD